MLNAGFVRMPLLASLYDFTDVFKRVSLIPLICIFFISLSLIFLTSHFYPPPRWWKPSTPF